MFPMSGSRPVTSKPRAAQRSRWPWNERVPMPQSSPKQRGGKLGRLIELSTSGVGGEPVVLRQAPGQDLAMTPPDVAAVRASVTGRWEFLPNQYCQGRSGPG